MRRAKVMITASGGARGKKVVPLKDIVDKGIGLAAKDGWQARHYAAAIPFHSACLPSGSWHACMRS